MEIFLWVVGALVVLTIARVQYIKYKARQRAQKIQVMIERVARDIEARAVECCRELEPVLRPAVVQVKPKKTTKRKKVVKKVAKKGKKVSK